MYIPDPEGGLSLSEEYLRATLAACPRFWAWCRAVSVAAALLRIHTTGLPLPVADNDGVIPDDYSRAHLVAARPFALVFADENTGYRLGRVGAPDSWDEAGALRIAFEQNIACATRRDLAAVERRFKNDLGVIAAELSQLAHQAGYLAIDQMLLTGPWRCHPDEIVGQGDHVYAVLQVTYGVGRGV